VSPALFALLVLAGALGAVARYLVDFLVTARTKGPFPWGILSVNLTGSFALGLLVGSLPEPYTVLLGTGFLGAYTTFSTWMVDTVRLLEGGAWRAAGFNALGSLALGFLAAAAGLWLAASA